MFKELQISLNTLESNKSSISMIDELISMKNNKVKVILDEKSLLDLKDWRINSLTKNIEHVTGKFFKIMAIKNFNISHPIIFQPEIGILGILASNISGVLHFLMQLKVEPGNVNGVQISPTFQATKSNYSRAHGGKVPKFFEIFTDLNYGQYIYSQLLSEQGNRYFKKKNNNVIKMIDEKDVESSNDYIWMTLGQIRHYFNTPNLINSCARSILSMLIKNSKEQKELMSLPTLFNVINSRKKFDDSYKLLKNISDLESWKYSNGELLSIAPSYSIKGFNIAIQDREVKSWDQPLFSENKKGEYGLIIFKRNNVRYIIWKIRNEVGLNYNYELGPTWIIRHSENDYDKIKSMLNSSNIIYDNDLSEEGGRFFNSVFCHKIGVSDIDMSPELDYPYVCLTVNQTQNLMNFSDFFTIEARSLWSTYYEN